MGTSQSSKGTKGKNPLVPSWADGSPEQGTQTPESNRHTPFRTALGRAASGGGRDGVKQALGHYARKSTGGGNAAARRLGSVIQSGGNLFDVLRGGTSSEHSINISDLSGLSCDQAISRITQALVPENGDGDKIRSAMNSALVDALDGVEIFDMASITDDILVSTMVNYLTESIFIQITMEGGDSWNNAETTEQLVQAEMDLKELVKEVVDEHMSPKISAGINELTSSEIIECEKQAVIDVWAEWESYQ